MLLKLLKRGETEVWAEIILNSLRQKQRNENSM